MDLSHVDDALAQQGAASVDAILGVDVYEAQAAVIDYGSASLFLRDDTPPDTPVTADDRDPAPGPR